MIERVVVHPLREAIARAVGPFDQAVAAYPRWYVEGIAMWCEGVLAGDGNPEAAGSSGLRDVYSAARSRTRSGRMLGRQSIQKTAGSSSAIKVAISGSISGITLAALVLPITIITIAPIMDNRMREYSIVDDSTRSGTEKR